MRSEPGSADRGRSLVPTGPRFRTGGVKRRTHGAVAEAGRWRCVASAVGGNSSRVRISPALLWWGRIVRPSAAVSKTAEGQLSVGSNPTPTAILTWAFSRNGCDIDGAWGGRTGAHRALRFAPRRTFADAQQARGRSSVG
jgi:hypothetical protein